MPTPLARKIKALIRTNGPISVTDYFALCLADPDYGYYRTRDPFGAELAMKSNWNYSMLAVEASASAY